MSLSKPYEIIKVWLFRTGNSFKHRMDNLTCNIDFYSFQYYSEYRCNLPDPRHLNAECTPFVYYKWFIESIPVSFLLWWRRKDSTEANRWTFLYNYAMQSFLIMKFTASIYNINFWRNASSYGSNETIYFVV